MISSLDKNVYTNILFNKNGFIKNIFEKVKLNEQE